MVTSDIEVRKSLNKTTKANQKAKKKIFFQVLHNKIFDQ